MNIAMNTSQKKAVFRKLQASYATALKLVSLSNQDNFLFEDAGFQNGLHEIAAASADRAAALGFACLAARCVSGRRPILFLTLTHQAQESGCLHGAGLVGLGLDPAQVVQGVSRTEKDLLWALEEGASCPGLGAVLAVFGQRERLYGFTASRRLKLRQEKSGVAVFIVRLNTSGATAASSRWVIESQPTLIDAPLQGRLPLLGPPRWRASRLERLGSPPKTWELECHAPGCVRLVTGVSDREDRCDRASTG